MDRKKAIKGIFASALGIKAAKDTISSLSDAPRAFTRNELTSPSDTSVSRVSEQGYKHSVCRWTYSSVPLEELCEVAIELNIDSIELLDPPDIKKVQQRGLHCAVANSVPLSLTNGFNDPSYHATLQKEYSELIPVLADLGIQNLICFSGNRRGIGDEQGMEHCAIGLDPIVALAQKYGITLVMELLNSKVDHKDYQCDHTAWGASLCEKIGSDHFKLLYDIYHMQVMEGDIIATIQKYHPYIAHYHTAGVPGRNEIDQSQELNYPAIMQAIQGTGFTGHVAQEFIPTAENKFDSLARAIELCTLK
jgi:hydroxypyruvate isomerase